MSPTACRVAPAVVLVLGLLAPATTAAQSGRLRIHVRPAPTEEWARDRADSVQDLMEALRKVRWATLVTAPARADLEIEITGRGSRDRPGSLPPPMPIPRPGQAGQPVFGDRSELAVYATVRLGTDPAGLHTYDLIGTSRSYRWKSCADDLVEQLEGWTAEGPPTPGPR